MEYIDQDAFADRYLKKLNPQQREAVLAVEGNILLLATPGSGKTTVLVIRLGYIICCRRIDPIHILTMTYTRAATRDMKARFVSLFGEEAAANLEFRTINGVCAKIIEYAGQLLGKPPYVLQDNEAELTRIIRQIYQAVNGEYADDSLVKDIKTGITYIKNMMLTHAEIQSLKSDIPNLAEIFARYNSVLKERRLMDYDDQMVYALNLLNRYPAILDHFQDQFRFVCVDEAQDTSKIQHELIKLLSAKHGNLFMVGDEDQSIYGFRAAYPQALLDFKTDHPGARILLMEENYRSTPEIVDLANRFISQNKARYEKTIRPTKEGGNEVHVINCKDRTSQFEVLFQLVSDCDRETAVLFRNNDSALPLIDLLEKNGIPYNRRNAEDLFFTHRIVSDIKNIILFAANPKDSDLFMQIYYKFGSGVSRKAAEEAVRLSAKSGKPILAELSHLKGIGAYTRDTINDLRENLPKVLIGPAEIAIRRIWDAMHYKSYAEQNGLDAGKLFILCFLARNVETATAFLEKLSDLQASLAAHSNQSDNKLILSTIHSSKGLEYEHVYLIDVVDGILPAKTPQESQTAEDAQEYEEARRLFYVAVTRAKNELFLLRTNESSLFCEEATADLPVHFYSDSDVFSFLSSPLVGKSYTHRTLGKGQIAAQLDDTCFIDFNSGEQKVMTLERMMHERDQSATIKPLESPETNAIAVKSCDQVRSRDQERSRGQVNKVVKSKDEIRIGMKIRHRTLGDGVVRDIRDDIISIKFKKKGYKRFQLSVCLSQGLLSIG